MTVMNFFKKIFNRNLQKNNSNNRDAIDYEKSKEVSLTNVGNKFTSRRAVTEVVKYNARKAIRKTFFDSDEAKRAFNNEIEAYRKFANYKWCPLLLEKGDNSFTIEFFDCKDRLDKRKNLSKEFLSEILWIITDLYTQGIAHCDIHSRNIYVTDEGIKLIDFETISKLPECIDLFESYDITGEGLESPFFTMNMCVMSKDPLSISSIFNVKNVSELQVILENRIKEQMLDASATFKSRKIDKEGRHALQTRNIYSTFDLRHIKVSPEEGQRNTFMRFERFGINESVISGKAILDIGSNIGATLLGLAKYNPAHMIGLEYDADKVALSNKLAKLNGIANVQFREYDIEAEKSIPEIKPYDVVFCLAVIEHLTNKEKLFNILGRVCKDMLYFEGNANSDIAYIETGLKNAGFTQINYLGFSDDEKNRNNNNRPLFIAQK